MQEEHLELHYFNNLLMKILYLFSYKNLSLLVYSYYLFVLKDSK